jgi:chromosome partitioning protein
MNARAIVFSNRKGGSGKTTTTVNVSAALAHRGKKVLVVDTDPQAHASLSFGVNGDGRERNLYRLLSDLGGPAEMVVDTYLENLKIIPAHRKLADFEQQNGGFDGATAMLADKLRPFYATFDFIVFDTAPTLNMMTLGALTASSELYVPMQTHFLALEGLAEMVRVVGQIKDTGESSLAIRGIIPTFNKERTRLNRAILQEIKNTLGEDIVLHPIRENISLAEAPSHGKTIFQYKLKSHGAYDYLRVADMIKGTE